MNNSGTAVCTVSIPDRKQVKAHAKEILSGGNNRVTLAVSLILFITASVTCLYIGYLAVNAFGYGTVQSYSLKYWILYIGYILWIALTALFGNLPILYGIYAVTVRMCRGEDVRLADVFEVFSDGEYYVKALKLSCRTVIKYIVPFAAFILFPELWIKLAAIVVALAVAFFSASDFGYAAETFEDTKIQKNGNIKKSIISFKFSFIPQILLAFASIGILFIIHTVPYMMISNKLYNDGLKAIPHRE